MPFVYPQYHSPYVQSLTQLIMAPGEAQAEAAKSIGQAQAQAQLSSGNAWANAANQIGQTVAAVPQQLETQKRNALQRNPVCGSYDYTGRSSSA